MVIVALHFQKVLILEHSWNDWKNSQCPSYVKKQETNQQRTRIMLVDFTIVLTALLRRCYFAVIFNSSCAAAD